MSDFGCPLAYLQNMVDADALPVEVLNALKENYCDEEGAKDTWDLVEKAELEQAELENAQLKCWATTCQAKVDKLELELAHSKKIEEKFQKERQGQFAKMNKLEEENKKLKNDLRLLGDGYEPRGFVGGIVECEREKRHKAEEELEQYKEELEEAHHQYDLLKEQNKELKLERERDTIAEVRSARDRALSENKKLKAKFEKFKEVLTQE